MLALPIFPGRLQPSIVSRIELNFRVRDGNGWTLDLINTNYHNCSFKQLLTLYSLFIRLSTIKIGDPYGIRTHVKGVRGLCLNHLTNGPFPLFYMLRGRPRYKLGTPSGTRTLDTLIKSQVLYQLS